MKHATIRVLGLITVLLLTIIIAGCTPDLSAAVDQKQGVELRTDNGYVQWRAGTEDSWHNLVAIADLKGADGAPGASGAPGSTGLTGDTGDRGTRGLTGSPGPTGATGPAGPAGPSGSPGRNIELQNNGTYIQWRYAGDTAWTNLATVASLTGPAGSPGPTGATGPAGSPGPTGATGPAGSPGPMGAKGDVGPTGSAGADGTAVAWAQYRVTTFTQGADYFYLQLADDVPSTDTALISLDANQTDIHLTGNHTYLISYHVAAENTTNFVINVAAIILDPNGKRYICQIEESSGFTSNYYQATASNTFLYEDDADHIIHFSVTKNAASTMPSLVDVEVSLVTITCLK